MVELLAITRWKNDVDGNISDVVRRYQGEFTDVAGQLDIRIGHNLACAFRAVVDDVIATLMDADNALLVFRSDDTFTNPQMNFIKNRMANEFGIPASVTDQISREQSVQEIVDILTAWMRTL